MQRENPPAGRRELFVLHASPRTDLANPNRLLIADREGATAAHVELLRPERGVIVASFVTLPRPVRGVASMEQQQQQQQHL